MEFPDEINLDQMKVFAAPFGGPIAITKDPGQVIKAGVSAKPVIFIYSSSGNLISKINVIYLLNFLINLNNCFHFEIIVVELGCSVNNGLV